LISVWYYSIETRSDVHEFYSREELFKTLHLLSGIEKRHLPEMIGELQIRGYLKASKGRLEIYHIKTIHSGFKWQVATKTVSQTGHRAVIERSKSGHRADLERETVCVTPDTQTSCDTPKRTNDLELELELEGDNTKSVRALAIAYWRENVQKKNHIWTFRQFRRLFPKLKTAFINDEITHSYNPERVVGAILAIAAWKAPEYCLRTYLKKYMPPDWTNPITKSIIREVESE